MKATLKPGLTHRFSYQVPQNKTVPHLYPEVPDFQAMPAVFATGFNRWQTGSSHCPILPSHFSRLKPVLLAEQTR